MIDPQLLFYIRQQLTAGVARENIVKALIAIGWNEQDISTAFTAIENPSLIVPHVPESKARIWAIIGLIALGIFSLGVIAASGLVAFIGFIFLSNVLSQSVIGSSALLKGLLLGAWVLSYSLPFILACFAYHRKAYDYSIFIVAFSILSGLALIVQSIFLGLASLGTISLYLVLGWPFIITVPMVGAWFLYAKNKMALYVVLSIFVFLLAGLIGYGVWQAHKNASELSQLFGTSGTQLADTKNDVQRGEDIGFIKDFLSQYASGNQYKYPASLDVLDTFAPAQSTFTGGVVPTDPLTKQPYIYNVGSDGSYYSLCTILSTNQYQCVDSSDDNTYTIDGDDIAPSQDMLQTFTDPNGAFSYIYPSGWITASTSPPGATSIVALAATSTDSTYALRASQFTAIKLDLPVGTTLDQAEQAMLNGFGAVSGFSNQSSQKITFHGDPAYLSTFYTSTGSIKLLNTTYLISHNGSLYDLYSLQKLEESALFVPALTNIINSFQILGSNAGVSNSPQNTEVTPSINSVSVGDGQGGWYVEVEGSGLIGSSLTAVITGNGQTTTLPKISTVVSDSQAFFLLPSGLCTQKNKYCQDSSLSVSVANGPGAVSNTVNIQ